MTSAYILVAYLLTYKSGGPLTAEFETKAACDYAVGQLLSAAEGSEYEIVIPFAKCFQKGGDK